jgi:hypothetical protein
MRREGYRNLVFVLLRLRSFFASSLNVRRLR